MIDIGILLHRRPVSRHHHDSVAAAVARDDLQACSILRQWHDPLAPEAEAAPVVDGQVARTVVPLAVPPMTPTPTPTSTATPMPTPTPLPTPTVTPGPPPPPGPVYITIPAIGVRSSVVPVPLVTDPRTGVADWDVDSLFRSGRRDLVGHLARSVGRRRAKDGFSTGAVGGFSFRAVRVVAPCQGCEVVDRLGGPTGINTSGKR